MKKLFTLYLFLFIIGIGFNLKAQTSFSKLTIGSVVTDSSDCMDASWADYDNDGDLDLFVATDFPSITNPGGNNLLFQNNCNGEFTKVTTIPGGIPNEGNSLVCTWIDYDNDGNTDLYVGNYNNLQNNYLYRNKGDGTFEKITDIAIAQDGKRTDGIAWADYDNDGFVDLFISNTDYQKNNLYHNNGDGTFTLITAGAIVNDQNNFSGAAWADFDNDGDMDLYVTTKWSGDYRNCLYVNNGDGTFTKDITNIIVSDPRMSNYYLGINYGCAWADYDNDLNLDLFVPSVYGGDYLYHNNGDGSFTSIDSGPVVSTTGVNNGGATWGDFDNDGDLDLFVSNFQKNYFYINNGDGTFTLDTLEIISNDTTVESYGASWADFDNDGDLDLFVPNAYGAPNNFLYLNIYSNNGNSNHWFKATLKGVKSNSSAIGARIYIKANINGKNVWQMREINASSAYTGGGGGAVSGLVTHFGLGNATIIDTIKVVWPASGITQIFTNVPINQFVEITENSNVINLVKQCTPDLPSKNVGYLKGKLYNDINNNCEYDLGIDIPIANKLIRAEPGTNFQNTDNNGDYTFKLPEGNYNIGIYLEADNWVVRDCQSSNYPVSVTVGDTIQGLDFGVRELALLPCNGGSYSLVISSMSITNGYCNGVPLSNPCPGYSWKYCFTVTNNTNTISPANTILSVNFPVGFLIQAGSVSSPSGCVITPNPAGYNTNSINITFNAPFIIGQSCTVCLNVFVSLGTNPAYYTQATFNNIAVTNLADNPDFNVITPLNILPFSTGYTNGCNGSGSYIIGPFAGVGSCTNYWNQTGFGGSGNFLIADGASNATTNVWCDNIPVTTNTLYNFSAWFNNIERPIPDDGFAHPNIRVLVNSTTLINSIDLPENPNIWLNGVATWCSQSNTSAQVCIRSTQTQSTGNDFGIDHISFNNAYAGPVSYTQQNSCGCDPNDKLVNPVGCGINGNISKTEKLTYKIRFQNTGTGPANNIIISDKINNNLDLSTLNVVASSHLITNLQIIPENNLIVEFAGIELPDSSSNSAGSMGFIEFEIAPKTGLADGTIIKNQAGIYFDNNEVVLTNTTINTLFDNPQPDASFSYKHSCSNTGIAYDFIYTGNTPDNANYLWEFEDANPSTSSFQNPTDIIFNTSGYKLVTLNVFRNGCFEKLTDSIFVSSPISINGKKVTICHNGNTITVSVNALQAHLAHGDCVGNCDNNLKSAKYFETISEESFKLQIIPNPSKGKFAINYLVDKSQEANEIYEISIYDVLGNVIYKSQFNYSGFQIDLTEKSKGIYFYKVSSENNFFTTGKLILK